MSKRYNRYQRLSKVSKGFYLKLALIFLFLFTACSVGLFIEYHLLENYEKSQPASALNRYMQRLVAKDFSAIYQEASLVSEQMNDEASFSKYIEDKYRDYDVASLYTSEDLACTVNNPDIHCYNIKADQDYTMQTLYVVQQGDQWYGYPSLISDVTTFISEDPSLTISVNGVELADNTQIEDSYYLAFDNIDNTGQLSLYTTYQSYEILEDDPLISVNNNDYAVVKNPLEKVYYIGKLPNQETLEDYETLIENVAKVYCQYITADASLYSLTSLLYPYSEFYDQILGFENIWFSDHDSIEFDNITIENVIELGDDGFIGEINFDYIVTAQATADQQRVYHSAYQITFIKYYNGYRASNIITMTSN